MYRRPRFALYVRSWAAALLVAGPALVAFSQTPVAHGFNAARIAADPCGAATRAKPRIPLRDFPATGLPAGPATIHPEYDVLPPSPPWKHSHGGPVFVYIISGELRVSDEHGTVTYCAGDFFHEPPGHVHTLTVVRTSEIFVLYIIPPGATRDIAAQ